MKILLVRHGQTPDNVRRVWPHNDVGLTDVGYVEADAAGDLIKAGIEDELWPSPWAIIASPLKRTVLTAQRIAVALNRDPDDVLTHPLLAERDFGPLIGQPSDPYLKGTDGHTYAELDTVPGVESLANVHSRAGIVLRHLVEHSLNLQRSYELGTSALNPGSLVIVSHKALLRGIQFAHQRLPYTDVYDPRPSVSIPVGPKNAEVIPIDISAIPPAA